MSHDPSLPKQDVAAKAKDPTYRWTGAIAVTTAVLAALASIASLLSGFHTDEATIEQIRASDKWGHYQSKSIKAAVLESKMELLPALGKEVAAKDSEKAKEYEADKATISGEAAGLQKSADTHRKKHAVLAVSVSSFQIAIGLCAIALLTKKTWFWAIALAAAAVGIGVMVYGSLLVSA